MSEPKRGAQSARRLAAVAAAALLLVLVHRLVCRGPKPFDYVRWKAERLELDPERIDHFVREGIRVEEGYAGVLKGPVGTLLDGAGSEADRAALREALLAAARGDDPPELQSPHRLELALDWRSGEESGSVGPAAVPVGLLPADPPVLEMRPGGVVLETFSGRDLLDLPHAPESLDDLVLRGVWHGPDGVPLARFRREIARVDEPRGGLAITGDAHVLVVLPCRLPSWAAARERAVRAAGDSPRATAYRLALDFLERSDRGTDAIAQAFGVRAAFDRPRLVIASALTRGGSGGRVLTLDLRLDDVVFEGPPKDCEGAALTRSVQEAFLERSAIEETTEAPAFGAADAFLSALEPMRLSSRRRLETYRAVLSHALDALAPGARLRFGPGKEPAVAFRHTDGHTLEVAALHPALVRAAEESGLPFTLRPGARVERDAIGRVAWELETLLGPLAGSTVDFDPEPRFEESLRHLFFGGSRLLIYHEHPEDPDDPESPKVERVDLSFRFLEAPDDGDLVFEVHDTWDEVNGRPYEMRSRFRIPLDQIEASHRVTTWYDQDRFDAGENAFFFSRACYRELVEQGFTIVQYADIHRDLSEPLKLWLCGREEARVYVNNRPRRVPVLLVAGGWLADDPPKRPYDEVEGIPEETIENGPTMNRWVVLDDPLFPLVGVRNLRFQTWVPGRVVARGTGIGVANVHIEVAGVATDSFPDGRFQLPILDEPFGVFTVRASAPGFAPLERQVDFRRADALPLRLEIEPRADADLFVTVRGPDDPALGRIEDGRTRRLLRLELEDAPGSFALAALRPVPYGPGRVVPWLLFDPAATTFVAGSDDGLHGASAMGALLRGAAAREPGVQGISAFSGAVASWYAYAAGRLDALAEQVGEAPPPRDFGHTHALRFALRFLDRMVDGFDTLAGRAAGARADAFAAGFRAGLSYFQSHPEFWGGS